MIGFPYWDRRLHLWGAWLATGSGRLSSTPLARLRSIGVRVQMSSDASAPMVHELERETDAMIRLLPARLAEVIDAYYRARLRVPELAVRYDMHPDTVRAWIRDGHRRLQRQLGERRNGKPLPRGKALNVRGEPQRGRGRTLASVVPEE